jgi:PAS domain-containing protein
MRSNSSSLAKCSTNQGLDQLMEAIGDVVFRLDVSGCIVHASARAVALIGPRPELPGAMLATLVADADQAAVSRCWCRRA